MSRSGEAFEDRVAAERRTRIEEIRNVIGDGVSPCPECNAEWTLPEVGAINKVMLHGVKCAAYTEPKVQDSLGN